MTKTPREVEEETRSQIEHIFGYLLDEIRTERALLGLPADFEFVCLIHGHSASGQIAAEIIRQFTEGYLIDVLRACLKSELG